MTLIEWIVLFLCLLLAGAGVWIVKLNGLLKGSVSLLKDITAYSKMVNEDVGQLTKALAGVRLVSDPVRKDELADQALEYLENRDKDYERFL